jgi:hypothetical protein
MAPLMDVAIRKCREANASISERAEMNMLAPQKLRHVNIQITADVVTGRASILAETREIRRKSWMPKEQTHKTRRWSFQHKFPQRASITVH